MIWFYGVKFTINDWRCTEKRGPRTSTGDCFVSLSLQHTAPIAPEPPEPKLWKNRVLFGNSNFCRRVEWVRPVSSTPKSPKEPCVNTIHDDSYTWYFIHKWQHVVPPQYWQCIWSLRKRWPGAASQCISAQNINFYNVCCLLCFWKSIFQSNFLQPAPAFQCYHEWSKVCRSWMVRLGPKAPPSFHKIADCARLGCVDSTVFHKFYSFSSVVADVKKSFFTHLPPFPGEDPAARNGRCNGRNEGHISCSVVQLPRRKLTT